MLPKSFSKRYFIPADAPCPLCGAASPTEKIEFSFMPGPSITETITVPCCSQCKQKDKKINRNNLLLFFVVPVLACPIAFVISDYYMPFGSEPDPFIGICLGVILGGAMGAIGLFVANGFYSKRSRRKIDAWLEQYART